MDYSVGNVFETNFNNCYVADVNENAACIKGGISIVEIFDVKEKRKWMELFRRQYSGCMIPLNYRMFGKYCRFFVAKNNGNSIGFIRITDKTEGFSKYCNKEVWCASDAFVKKAFRNYGVLRELLNHVVKNCDVKFVRLESERLIRCYNYYQSLGFSSAYQIEDSDLSVAVQTDFIEISNQRNADVDVK
jgi:GNAT superfamily N-acetyltransferase